MRVNWIDALPGAGFRGVMLANEVLDAMSVERFQWDGDSVTLVHVCADGDNFTWQRQDDNNNKVTAEIEACLKDCQLDAGYVSEYNPGLQPWLASVADCLEQGVILLIDYGYPRHEYFHPQHSSGTLMCHYRHYAHADEG